MVSTFRENMESLAWDRLKENNVDVVGVSTFDHGYGLVVWIDSKRVDEPVFKGLRDEWPTVMTVETTDYTEKHQDVMKVTFYAE